MSQCTYHEKKLWELLAQEVWTNTKQGPGLRGQGWVPQLSQHQKSQEIFWNNYRFALIIKHFQGIFKEMKWRTVQGQQALLFTIFAASIFVFLFFLMEGTITCSDIAIFKIIWLR